MMTFTFYSMQMTTGANGNCLRKLQNATKEHYLGLQKFMTVGHQLSTKSQTRKTTDKVSTENKTPQFTEQY